MTSTTAGSGTALPLADQFGRVATDLRVSVTDKCNLRCSYCMPEEGLQWLSKPELLTADELVRLMRLAVEQLGITEIRFTGGEPTLRPDLPEIVARCGQLRPRPQLSLTTNALRLGRLATQLTEAGLDRINVSLDTVRRETFRLITRRDKLSDVLEGMQAAYEAGLRPVKVNAVLLRGVNDDQAPELLRYCLQRDYQLRFIEQMPLDAQHGWRRDRMITASEILEWLQAQFQLEPHPEHRGSAPAQRWLVDGGPGTVGVIGSVTQPFCMACDRTRLTADGQVRNCLFATGETDLRGALRSGADDAAIGAIWQQAMWGKAAGHGINESGFHQPDRPMSAIGG